MTGDVLYKKIRDINLQVPVIVISSQENITTAVNLLKMGVSDYLVKDDSTKDLLWNSIIRIKETLILKKEVESLREELAQKFSFDKSIIGQSVAIKKTFSMMEKAIKTNINVSISGETGTGKEIVAKAIHYNSDRKKRAFIPVNMAAIPKELIESELFGYEKGAFTGANTSKTGKFEESNGGTIFLDEIGELDLAVQSKLLRVLQEREVVRIGAHEKIKLDLRLIVATHKNLADEVSKGNFREDLYYRIVGLPIELPPLRERNNDILILAKYFMDDFARQNKLGTFSIAQDAKNKLLRHKFPGNVRELKSVIELAVVMCENNTITANDITLNTAPPTQGFGTEDKTLREHMLEVVKHYLKKNSDDLTVTAKVLDIGKSTIYKMLKAGHLD
jgi:DNA-binding NtrC family response regulator